MELRWISLLSSLAATTYLLGWLIRQLRALYALGHTWWSARRITSRIAALKPPDKIDRRAGILVGGLGLLAGAFGAYGLSQVLTRESLLLGIVVLLLLSEEFQPATREKELLAVLVLIDHFRAHCLLNEDLFEILAGIVQELPDGEVQRSVRESIFRRRNGDPVTRCLAAMAGIDPFLDEFILNLRLVDGPGAGPALALILSRLQDRAGKKWDVTSQLMLMKNKTRLPFLFGRTLLIAGGWILLIGFLLEWIPAFLTQLSWTGLVGAVLGLGLLIYLIHTQKWARRCLVILMPLLALVIYGNTFSL